MNEILLEPIGHIETCFKERFGTPRQPSLVPSSWGIIRLRPELNLAEALDGLESFTHIWLIFVFHQNTNRGQKPGDRTGFKTKIHPPRMDGEKLGVFSTRTPHRPNPIGLSAVKLEKIEGSLIHVSGVDLIDGTPILDIKPYLPSSDCLLEAGAGWTGPRPERTVTVEFSPGSLADLARLLGPRAEQARRAIAETLELDPRPVFYKGTPDDPNPYTDVYGFRFDDFNVVYRSQGSTATVLGLQPWNEYMADKTRAGHDTVHP